MATSIRLTHQIEQRINSLAHRTGRTKAFYLREMIARGLDEMEDYYLGLDVLERVRKGEENIESAGAVRKDLGLES
jgi:RHH-type rel operon transcriptional repressor/antitoxin RelB